MTIPNITKTVMKGFGTGVGGFSNTATILYAMAAIFNKPEQKDQQDEIMNRIKLLREIVGQEIDRIKGADKPSLPAHWRQFESFNEDDSNEEKMRKAKHNAMVVSKKPYFFRYLYPELNKRYKQFENSYNQVSKDMFGIKFKKLLKKEDKTEDEKTLVKNYQKFSPLITSDCTMNCLCREFESVDFDIKYHKHDTSTGEKGKPVSLLPTFEEEYRDKFDITKYNTVKSLYKSYNARRSIKHLDALLDPSLIPLENGDYSELRSSLYTSIIESLQTQLNESEISGQEFLFYTNRLSTEYSNFNWAFAWDLLEDQIIKLIPQGKTYVPVRNELEGIEYLGEKYCLEEISYEGDISVLNIASQVQSNIDEQTLTDTFDLVIDTPAEKEEEEE